MNRASLIRDRNAGSVVIRKVGWINTTIFTLLIGLIGWDLSKSHSEH